MTDLDDERALRQITKGASTALTSLKEDLAPEQRNLAEALRGLLASIGLGVRHYAASNHLSAAAVSRYLSGRRIPDKAFIDDLLRRAVQHLPRPVPAEVESAALSYLYDLHLEALRVSNPLRHKIQLLTDELGSAVLFQEQTTAQVVRLEQAVADREQRLAELRRRTQQLETAWAEDRDRTQATLEVRLEREEGLDAECRRLHTEVVRLREQLRRARALHGEAEARCAILEARLATVEEEAERQEQARDAQPTHERQVQLGHEISLKAEPMQRESGRLTTGIQGLIDLTSLQSDNPVSEARPVEVDDVVSMALFHSDKRARSKSVELVRAGSQGLRVLGDKAHLTMALGKLLDNAITYSDENAQVVIDVRSSGDMVEIAVTDHGIGIPEEHLQHIFERFYRVDRAHSMSGGAVLGLSIVKQVAAGHGGDVLVQSEEGVGSTFALQIPRYLG